MTANPDKPGASPLRRIVLTGGPGAGKTVITARLAKDLAGQVHMVPEAATYVYQSLGVLWTQLDVAGRRDAQLRMYRHQLAMEAKAAVEFPHQPHLLDRGTIDGATYWPDGTPAFWPAVGSTLEAELGRYWGVLYLHTAAEIGIYDGAESNKVRFESPQQAIDAGNRLLDLWGKHPRLIHIHSHPDLEVKIQNVKNALKDWGILQ